MNQHVRISVTEQDILDAEAAGSLYKECPVARAASRALNQPVWVVNDDDDEGDLIIIGQGATLPNGVTLDKDSTINVRKWDRGFGMVPFDFEVDVTYDSKGRIE